MANKTLDQLTQKTGKLADTDKFHVRGANDQYMEFLDLYKQTGLHAYGSLGALITQFQSENIFRDGDRVQLLGFGAAGDGGGGPVYYDASEDRANHNGGSIIDPTHSVTPGSAGWWTAENSGTGCFIRKDGALIRAIWFGLNNDGSTSDSTALQSAIDIAALKNHPVDARGLNLSISSVDIKTDVKLLADGSIFVPNVTSSSVFNVYPGAGLLGSPIIDTTGVIYTGNAVVLDPTAFGSSYRIDDKTRIDAEILGTAGNGDGLYLHQNGLNDFISWVDFHINIDGFENCINIFSEGSGGWINSNRFTGYLRGGTNLLNMSGDGAISSNELNVTLQPTANTDYGWIASQGGANILRGRIWDDSKINFDTINFSGGVSRNVVMAHGDLTPSKFVDTSTDQDSAVYRFRGNRMQIIVADDTGSGTGVMNSLVFDAGIEQHTIYGTRVYDVGGSGINMRENFLRNFRHEQGPTADRPSSSGNITGMPYFDTDLGQPIWFDGAGWVDATGASV